MTRPSLHAALDGLVDAAQPLPNGAFRARADAIRTLAGAPFHTVLLGRVGVGKTSLANRLLSLSRPVGLGGVTGEVEILGDVDRIVDPPGIDDPVAAIDQLGPLLAEADRAIWVVDGLQPMTATEREVVEATLPPDLPLVVVVARRDLIDPVELPAVLARVRSLVPAGTAVEAFDLRSDGPAIGTHDRSPRWARVRQDLAALRQEAPVVHGTDEIVGIWRAEVQRGLREVEEHLQRHGWASHEMEALADLAERAEDVLARVRTTAGEPALSLPAFEPARRSHPVRAGLAGTGGALRAVRDAAARWLMAGEIALREEADPGRQVRRQAAIVWVAALDAALTALPVGSAPSSTAADLRV